MPSALQAESFDDFYNRVYKSQHRNKLNRVFHLIGTLVGAAGTVYGISSAVSSASSSSTTATTSLVGIPVASLVAGWGIMALGHIVFEKNFPKPFKTPAWTFAANLRSCFELLIGK